MGERLDFGASAVPPGVPLHDAYIRTGEVLFTKPAVSSLEHREFVSHVANEIAASKAFGTPPKGQGHKKYGPATPVKNMTAEHKVILEAVKAQLTNEGFPDRKPNERAKDPIDRALHPYLDVGQVAHPGMTDAEFTTLVDDVRFELKFGMGYGGDVLSKLSPGILDELKKMVNKGEPPSMSTTDLARQFGVSPARAQQLRQAASDRVGEQDPLKNKNAVGSYDHWANTIIGDLRADQSVKPTQPQPNDARGPLRPSPSGLSDQGGVLPHDMRQYAEVLDQVIDRLHVDGYDAPGASPIQAPQAQQTLFSPSEFEQLVETVESKLKEQGVSPRPVHPVPESLIRTP